MASAAEEIQDAAIRHATFVHRYGGGLAREAVELLRQVEADLIRQLELPAPGADVYRLDALLGEIQRMLDASTRDVTAMLEDQLRKFAQHEADWQVSTIHAAAGADLGMVKPAPAQLWSAITAAPMDGMLLTEVFENFGAARKRNATQAIRLGYLEGESIEKLRKRLQSAMEIDARNAEKIARTAVADVAAAAQEEVARQNEDLIDSIEWNATLDGRTTQICRARDGKRYTLDGDPIGHSLPWLGGPGRAHWQCRSTAIKILKSPKALGLDVKEPEPGERPFFRSTESSLKLGERLKNEGYEPEEIREIKARLTGQVPASEPYAKWLKRQPRSFVEDALGKKRAALFLDGKLPIERFESQGRELTLAELRARESRAWARADIG